MPSRTGRTAALLGVAAAFAFAAPAQATHYSCSFVADPECNVQYTYDHNVSPLLSEAAETEQQARDAVQPTVDAVDPYRDQVEGFLTWCSASFAGCARDMIWVTGQEAKPAVDAVAKAYDDARAEVTHLTCQTIGAC
jgi:hypothetical protein